MSDNAAQKIKEKLDLVEFLRGYLELKPAGSNFKANCPFHKEKTASFMVSPERQIWHCFGCNEGGDIFQFLMKYENLEFYEALKVLAEKAGVDLGRVSPSEQKQFGVLYDINNAASVYFKESIIKAPAVLEYLAGRKLSKESIDTFDIGFAPNDFEGLVMYLVNKGFDVADAARAGLVHKTQKGKYIDRFRGRIMFPLESNFGKVVGFTGRILPQFDTGDVAKYMNSPETPIFSKSRLLYGLSRAKEGIREKKFALLVEGQMDVIMSHQDGVNNVIGTSGTALTDEQLSILRRYSDKLVLNFDNDEAGKMAMERSIDLAYAKDFEVEVLDFSAISEADGLKDPADIVASKPGILKNFISRSMPAMEYYFLRHPVSGDIGDKKQNVRVILRKISNIKSAIESGHWLKELSFRSNIRETDLISEMRMTISSQAPKRESFEKEDNSKKEVKKSRKEMIAERLLALYFASDFAKEEIKKIKEYLPSEQLRIYNAIVSTDPSQDEDTRQKIAELSLKSGLEDESGSGSDNKEENIEREIKDLSKNLEIECLIEKRDALSALIKSNKLSEEEKFEKSLENLEIIKKIEGVKKQK
ncbi:MAG: DNA primase [Candidatus Colwellbacteria bacterium]|nr:DNA primase [Candidatus Colwellbacteria bacterium]